jgi:hypothetical protein
MTNYKYSHAVFDNAIKEMKRESLKVHAAQIAFASGVSVRELRGFGERQP